LTQKYFENLTIKINPKDKFSEIVYKPLSTPAPTSTSKPTPKPLTFTEMSALYGPCVHLPVLMYHHIQSRDAAKADKQTNLTVYTDVFQSQMQYLKSKNYNTVTMNDLVNFFDAGTPVPAKSILLTFDDGYQDFYTDAYPILSAQGYRATMFVPTGLMQNPDYLTWDEISGMNASVLFANHTWSHANIGGSTEKMKYEISTADSQLSQYGLNIPKTFAYPYGFDSSQAETYLNSLGYKAAFTTVPGSVLCKKQRFDLPRVRIGNSPLSNYGF
jgi:peptidoglycan/xylan/chitin deacetylase (PgdA/CDA1 family)